MNYPDFFDTVEPIILYDPLAELLGTFEAGKVTFSYRDVVKAAGHSCPTVAGAYLMTRLGLEALYAETLPVRGRIKVCLQEAQDEGTTGVTAAVVSQITGAAGCGGFKGLDGRFARNGLIEFGADIPGTLRLQCLDSGEAVDCRYMPQALPPEPELRRLMSKAGSRILDAGERRTFGKIWQKRVRNILEGYAGIPGLLRIERLQRPYLG